MLSSPKAQNSIFGSLRDDQSIEQTASSRIGDLTSSRLKSARKSAQPVVSRNLMRRTANHTTRLADSSINLKTQPKESKVEPRKFEKERRIIKHRKSFMDQFRSIRHKDLERNIRIDHAIQRDLPFSLSPRKVFRKEFN